VKAKTTLTLELNYQGQTKKFESTQSTFTIGRSQNCEISVPKSDILSREHLRVEVKDDEIWITDLNSSNGTYYHDVKLTPFKAVLYYRNEPFFFGNQSQGLTVMIGGPDATKLTERESVSEPEADDVPRGRLDESLLQMQVIEDELEHLTHKRNVLRAEVDQLASREAEFKKLQIEYDSNRTELVKLKSDLSNLDVELDRGEGEFKRIQGELEIKRTQLKAQNIELEACKKSLEACQLELGEARTRFEKTNIAFLEKVEDAQKLEAKVTGFIADETRLLANLSEKEIQFAALEASVDRLESERDAAEQKFNEQCIEFNAEIIRLATAKDTQAELFNSIQSEHERFKKQSELEVANFAAEAKLRKVTLECEVEEILTRKTVLIREANEAKHTIQSSERAIADFLTEKEKLNLAVTDARLQLATLQENVDSLAAQKVAAETKLAVSLKRSLEVDQEVHVILKSAEKNADLIHKLATDQKEKAKNETLTWVAEQKAALKSEQAELMAKFTADQERATGAFQASQIESTEKLAQKHADAISAFDAKRSELEIEHQAILTAFEMKRAALEKEISETFMEFDMKRIATEKEQSDRRQVLTSEFEEIKKRAQRDHEAVLVSLKEKANQQRSDYAEELRLWSTEEDARVKKMVAENGQNFAHLVSMRTLAEFQSTSSVSIASLLEVLEKKIVESLSGQVKDEGIYNPNLKKNVRSFWIQAGAGAAALVAVICGFHFGPQFIGDKLDVLKVANQKEDARFMEEVKHQRELMLALNLKERDEFQDDYVDNVLYNRGYLAMKLDPEVQKLWTVDLSKFFFEALLFDDRKVVDFMPIEASLMSSLSETYKVLNSQNFTVNLAQMKKIDEAKTEEMWLLVGGKDNWLKLRKREMEFYTKHVTASLDSARVPASK
jgi:pSer/pThr/pTyr-binding forkhead associated (FHA) protein